jgi:hypothetical protein
MEDSPFSVLNLVNSFNICSIFSLVFVLLVLRLKPGFKSWVFIRGVSILFGVGLALMNRFYFQFYQADRQLYLDIY